MKDYDFETLLGIFLKTKEILKNVYKFECEKNEEVNWPAVWSLGHELSLRCLQLNKECL